MNRTLVILLSITGILIVAALVIMVTAGTDQRVSTVLLIAAGVGVVVTAVAAAVGRR
jgi:hypothetical protein